MNGSNVIRQTHRWVSIVFTLCVTANFVAMGVMGTPPMWVTFSPLPPLFVLLLSGLFMFAQPHVARWRAARPAG